MEFVRLTRIPSSNNSRELTKMDCQFKEIFVAWWMQLYLVVTFFKSSTRKSLFGSWNPQNKIFTWE
jgi:hypothetical protein